MINLYWKCWRCLCIEGDSLELDWKLRFCGWSMNCLLKTAKQLWIVGNFRENSRKKFCRLQSQALPNINSKTDLIYLKKPQTIHVQQKISQYFRLNMFSSIIIIVAYSTATHLRPLNSLLINYLHTFKMQFHNSHLFAYVKSLWPAKTNTNIISAVNENIDIEMAERESTWSVCFNEVPCFRA